MKGRDRNKPVALPLTRGKIAVIDSEDFDWLMSWKWSCSANGYAYRNHKAGKKQSRVYLHRFILDCPTGLEVDHINRNRLDNRKSNLRICLSKENNRNVSLHKDNLLGLKGVVWDRKRRKWVAYICHDGLRMNLGGFDSPGEAVEAYWQAASWLFNKFARP